MFGFIILVVTSLLAMVNPLSAVPMYLSLTGEHTPEVRKRMLRRGIIASILILAVFATAGTLIMKFFGITTTAFRLAGGLIFLASGWEMMHGARANATNTDETRDLEATHPADISIIPLATPLLAGPGSITMVITMDTRAGEVWQKMVIYGAIVVVMLLTWAVLTLAPAIGKKLGRTGLNITTRLFGLLVIVIGMQFLADGVVEVARRVMHG